MTIMLDLTPETEARLRLDAGDRGLEVKEYLQQYLDTLPKMTGADYGHLFSQPLTDEERRSRQAFWARWDRTEADVEEQRDTLDQLQKALASGGISLREVTLPEGSGG